MKSRTKNVYIAGFVCILLLTTAGLALAAFGDKGKVLGSKFTVASADIKLLMDVSQSPGPTNLADEIQGPELTNISANWSYDYLVKIYNTGTTDLQLASNANYTTTNDPDDLRSIIYVEPILWQDNNENGLVDEGEEGESLGKKTIVKWKTEGFSLGNIAKGTTKGILLRFTTVDVSETKQGKSGIFDFEFESIEL